MKRLFGTLLILLVAGCTETKTEYVYKNVYPELPAVESPLVLATFPCKSSMPETPDQNVFIGFDKENFKCYLKNQEINREQKRLYENFVKEINKERENWKRLNKTLDK